MLTSIKICVWNTTEIFFNFIFNVELCNWINNRFRVCCMFKWKNELRKESYLDFINYLWTENLRNQSDYLFEAFDETSKTLAWNQYINHTCLLYVCIRKPKIIEFRKIVIWSIWKVMLHKVMCKYPCRYVWSHCLQMDTLNGQYNY